MIPTITGNPWIRNLAKCAALLHRRPSHSACFPRRQTLPSVLSASLALDYRLGGGLNPLWFHLSTFVWYVVQLSLMYLLFIKVLNLISRNRETNYVATLAVAWYGLHPVNAETINYVVQRGDLTRRLEWLQEWSSIATGPGVEDGDCTLRRWRPGR